MSAFPIPVFTHFLHSSLVGMWQIMFCQPKQKSANCRIRIVNGSLAVILPLLPRTILVFPPPYSGSLCSLISSAIKH
uniref:Secreted protein n=1 Tax=Echinococcus granulosus TaxID=6210 RepID=A0A068WXL9_ECHGR|nr:hypothetical protein EgrG_000918200 [Echinococcus granulosus]